MKASRAIVEKYIGRPLYNPVNLFMTCPEFKFEHDVFEVVHHINRDETDNRPENLYVFRDTSKHSEYHREVRDWAFGLMGLNQNDKVEYLKTLPELKSNLDQLKKWHEEDSTVGRYFDD